MGKSTISMAIFNSYAKLPEGIPMDPVVPSARKWDWGIIYYNLRRVKYSTFSDSGHGSIGYDKSHF